MPAAPQSIVVRSNSILDPEHIALLLLFEDLLAIKFHFHSNDDNVPAGYVTLVEPGAPHTQPRLTPTFTLPFTKAGDEAATSSPLAVSFLFHPDVPLPFRGTTLSGRLQSKPRYSAFSQPPETLATTSTGPVWWTTNRSAQRHSYSAFCLPRLSSNEVLCDLLHGDQFFEMLPLLQFLTNASPQKQYSWANQAASFMIDDPNLHSPTYGYANFSEIAKRAAVENYHVSFATIPLDTWYTHKTTASIFLRNPAHISLLVHGNNHTYLELASNALPPRRIGLLQQAVSRVERLERQTGLGVARVMAPPHGACTDDVLSELPACGFRAATVDHRSLREYNLNRPWTRSLGFLPCERIRKCPVIPRWGFTGFTRNSILLASYLHQPMVFMGHHQDFREGTDFLDHAASVINALGQIHWSNMADLCDLQYQWCMEGRKLKVIPWTNRVVVALPDSAAELIIDDTPTEMPRYWQVTYSCGTSFITCSGESVSLETRTSRRATIQAVVEAASSAALPPKWLHPWPFFRRVLTESRDRILSRLPFRTFSFFHVIWFA